jgi:hypothetical protein
MRRCDKPLCAQGVAFIFGREDRGAGISDLFSPLARLGAAQAKTGARNGEMCVSSASRLGSTSQRSPRLAGRYEAASRFLICHSTIAHHRAPSRVGELDGEGRDVAGPWAPPSWLVIAWLRLGYGLVMARLWGGIEAGQSLFPWFRLSASRARSRSGVRASQELKRAGRRRNVLHPFQGTRAELTFGVGYCPAPNRGSSALFIERRIGIPICP